MESEPAKNPTLAQNLLWEPREKGAGPAGADVVAGQEAGLPILQTGYREVQSFDPTLSSSTHRPARRSDGRRKNPAVRA